ncbi:hypothetical protein BBAG_0079 [Bifidobacterium angulatum DSM 20098 = JCM 7096]|nr:hypothetical protein BBAG_0079 [Bifidobacterium angulatum DSM 20098 = JCM 7096]
MRGGCILVRWSRRDGLGRRNRCGRRNRLNGLSDQGCWCRQVGLRGLGSLRFRAYRRTAGAAESHAGLNRGTTGRTESGPRCARISRHLLGTAPGAEPLVIIIPFETASIASHRRSPLS